MYNNKLVAKAETELLDKFKKEGVEIINIDIAKFQAAAQPFYSMPEVTAKWSPGIVEATNKAKAGK